MTQWFYFWEFIWRNLKHNSKEYVQPYVHCSIIYNSRDLEAAHVSISGQVNKIAVVHLHNGILLNSKNEESSTLCDNMDGPGEHHAKWNKPVKDKYHMVSLICGLEWTNWTIKQNRDRLRDREQADGSGEGCWGEGGLSKKEK